MENFRPPFTPSTTTASSSSPSSTLESSSSQLYHDPVVCYLPPHPHWQQPPCFSYPPPMRPDPVPSSAAWETRMARQRRGNILRTRKAARAAAASSRLAVGKDPSSAVSETPNEQYIYSFCTPDNKLKNSDVGSLGRIVLPKKEAEKYLPSLSDKEGIELRIRDALSTQEWGLKYKYWSNNKSRMYVLENTGDFVRQSGVEVGDSIHLYEDECKNIYVSIHRQAQVRPVHVVKPSSTSYHQQNYTHTNTNTAKRDNTNTKTKTNTTIDHTNSKTHANTTSIYTPYAYNETGTGEVETSSAVVLLQQQRNEQLIETNNMVTLFTDPASSYRQSEEASNTNNDVTRQQQTSTQPAMAGIFGSSSSSSSSPSIVKMAEDNFGDCYEGLGTLPEVVDRFNHSLFDFDDIIRDDKTL
ncbi:B3 domain-containing transcription factor LEC2-like isoform X2 [Rosa rugosa]|uniref:B3 domain-containing transcription factor LEC2-like isoform X2 n=1 Tax=Rosa rugosa TaxID=74645 RepID=UPI002B407DE6|nr:B3 domain-containing transcription factor LEC2-like isoform X2 [Rosa rugosa]